MNHHIDGLAIDSVEGYDIIQATIKRIPELYNVSPKDMKEIIRLSNEITLVYIDRKLSKYEKQKRMAELFGQVIKIATSENNDKY